jgi:hypothetical protein
MKTIFFEVEKNIVIILVAERNADFQIFFILQKKLLRLFYLHWWFSVIGQLLFVIDA